MDAESQLLAKMLTRHFGKHALLIGAPNQKKLLQAGVVPCHTLLSPMIAHEESIRCIESDLQELPIYTGCVDLVLLPHTMEFLDNPRQLLAEACRIIKPEGLIVITGFNPISLWGANKILTKEKKVPWSGNFIRPGEIIKWLKLADFQMEEQKSTLFRPPMRYQNLFEKFKFLEIVGDKCLPALGGVYALIARAKVVPLTPIKMKWKQQLSGIRISTSLPGHVRLLPNEPRPMGK